LTFAATDFEARADDNTYEVEITASKAGEDNAIQTIIVTLNMFENTITIDDQARSVEENSTTDTNIGAPPNYYRYNNNLQHYCWQRQKLL
ncbi:hypothetical protein, partial [Bathymodiolus thermophilus thioautotrophic gill symbiont]